MIDWSELKGMLADEVGLEAVRNKPIEKWVVKMGFDPTAPDLHLGHAVGLFVLRRLQESGATIKLIVGDFTAKIGDPTGRNDLRPSLGDAQINENASTYASQAFLILDEANTVLLRNSTWLEELGASGMVRLAASATVAQMLAREDFSKRFAANAPIGAHELLYPLLQGRDSVEVVPDVEFGGTDQRFNLLMGRELMKSNGMAPQACAMVPLLVGLDGVKKMSKSLGNHIALKDAPLEKFSKAMSISDATMDSWIAVFKAPARNIDPMLRKKELASWIVAMVDGESESAAARTAWEQSRQKANWAAAAAEVDVLLPTGGRPWAAVLRQMGWEGSAEQAKKRILQGALSIDGVKLFDAASRAEPQADGEPRLLVKYGSKKVALLKIGAEPS